MGDRQGQERTGSQTADDDQVAHDAGDQESRTKFRTVGGIPMPQDFPIAQAPPTASDMAFGSISLDPNAPKKPTPPLIGQKPGDAEALEARLYAEKLLKAESWNPDDPATALDTLNSVAASHRSKVIDQLDQKAFDNLLVRLAPKDRERLGLLVDASQDPKRKLKLWAAQHVARAENDLAARFPDPGEEPDPVLEPDKNEKYRKESARHTRRQNGVTSTQSEVEYEVGLLQAKQDLSVADVDKMRERKDEELAVEMKHNINLKAERELRSDDESTKSDDAQVGTRVVWETKEIAQLDAALDRLPDEHVHDDNSVATYMRRDNRGLNTAGGDNRGDVINVYDNANKDVDDRDAVLPLGYTVTHEVGHEVASENEKALKKFEQIAGWKEITEQDVRVLGATEDDMENMHEPRNIGGKVVHRKKPHHEEAKEAHDKGEELEDKFVQVDDTAIPSKSEAVGERWDYSHADSGEHFAEMYAMAVETPHLLYRDYIERPQQVIQDLRRKLSEQQNGKASAAEMAETKRQLARAEKIQTQRKQLFDLIRIDIFHAQETTRAAVARLKARGADKNTITAFEEKALKVSTPKQIARLEEEAMK